jgi:predicted O-linked N-acetylglucosamine transferase (SPINDLY family)
MHFSSSQESWERAVAFYQGGDLQSAADGCSRILADEPANWAALHLLSLVRFREGRKVDALTLIEAALSTVPDAGGVLFTHGLILHALGKHDAALASIDRALAANPDDLDLLTHRCVILNTLSRFDEALATNDRAAAISPLSIALLDVRGATLTAMGHHTLALECLNQVLRTDPNRISPLYNMAYVLGELERFDDALAGYRKLLSVKPDYAPAWNNQGNILYKMLRLEDALSSFDSALALKPDLAAAHFNRATVLQAMNRRDDALASYDQALALAPDDANIWNNRGSFLLEAERFDEARGNFERALAIDALNRYAYGGAATAAMNLCDWVGWSESIKTVENLVRQGHIVIPPLTFLGYSANPGLQLECAKVYERTTAPRGTRPPPRNVASGRRDRIRVAYLSSDFHAHATAFLTAELFERHDRADFDVIAISYGIDDGSDMRARLVRAFDQFHDIRHMNDTAAAALLRDLGVDIVVDLKGHTRGARLGILRSRPCPIQVNYLGYPGTIGVDFYDYIIGDAIVLPKEEQHFFSEKIVHLPNCYQVNCSIQPVVQSSTRGDCGLPDNGFVFCCFNNNWKITPPLFDVWMRLLGAVPESVLWLLGGNEGAMCNLVREAGARGIDPGRLIFADRVSRELHLPRHELADLFLDTLPYNAHSTASDALRMGLPLVTCRGESFAGRVAASLLHAANLPELAAASLPDYETMALDLARNGQRLRTIRQTLLENRELSPLFDTDRFRRDLENLYRTMWTSWCRRETPYPMASVNCHPGL